MQVRTKDWVRGFIGPGRFALLGLFAVITLDSTYGDSITLAPSADTSIIGSFPDNNLGANSNLVAGGNGSGFPNRALLRFDLANQIPANAIIQSVVLTMKVVTVPGGGGIDSVFELRRALLDWAEGTGKGNTGNPANHAETTWDYRSYPATPWTLPGGAVSNDFSGTSSASRLVGAQGSYAFGSTTNLIADIRQWALNPATNFGWVLMSESENTAFTSRRFGSREDSANSPLLEINYTLPIEIRNAEVAGDQVRFSFPASAGNRYLIQYQDSLAPGIWLTLTNFGTQINSTNLIALDRINANAHRFYRVYRGGSF